MYRDEVDVLSPMVRLFNVYDISTVDVKSIDKKFRIIKNPFQWTIGCQTLIRLVPEATPNLCYFLDNLTPLSKIPDANKDIIGIIIDANEVSKIPLSISLWDEMIDAKGHALVQAAKRRLPVVAKRLAIKTFNSFLTLVVNPPIEAAANMRSWLLTIQEPELELLKTTKASTYTKELVASGKMRTYTLYGVLSNAPNDDYWIKGFLRLIDGDQKFYYVACNNCLTKVKADIVLHYTCFLCKQNVVACLRPLVVMFVVGETEKAGVVAVQKVAARILQTTSDMTTS